MLLNEIKPAPALAQYVRLYRIIDFQFDNSVIIPPKMYSPRPEHCLQFYLRDLEKVFYPSAEKRLNGARAVLVGQHTVLQHRQIGHCFLSLQVVFQPAGLHQLLGWNMPELANTYLDARDMLGAGLDAITEQLADAESYPAMISIVEQYLLQIARRRKVGEHRVDSAMYSMMREEEQFKLDYFLNESCLSHRQFDRKFQERVGISPKQYLQVIRFDKAFRMKNKYPQLDWLSIAIRCGYHDYQHLARDYKSFTSYTPPAFYAIDSGTPERHFGEAEI